MLSKRRSLVLLVAGVLVFGNSLRAESVASPQPPQQRQQHVVGNDELEAALARSLAAEAGDREAIRDLLRHQHVQQIAATLGLEVKTADTAVSALEGAELAQLASGARVVDAALAGGQSLTLTYTTIIIILLVVILLILVA